MCWSKCAKEKARMEAKYEVEKQEKEMYKKLYYSQNNNDRQLIDMIIKFESGNTCGEAGYRDIVRRVKEGLMLNTEKLLSDVVLSNFTSNSNS